MHVAVAYAEVSRQLVQELDVADGTTARELIQRSGILSKFPQIDLNVNKIGVFGKTITLETVLNDGDRVEIYRPALGKPPKKDRTAPGKQAADEDGDGE